MAIMKSGISRRAFLGLGATAAVAAGAGLAGCSPASNASGTAQAEQGSAAAESSWKTPPAEITDFAKEYDCFELCRAPLEAAKEADVIITDVWASMGQEGEAEKRKKAFAGYQINEELMAAAHKDAMVQHCLPAHRGEEITAEVFEAHAAEIFEEAENRLHAQKAVMVQLMADKA